LRLKTLNNLSGLFKETLLIKKNKTVLVEGSLTRKYPDLLFFDNRVALDFKESTYFILDVTKHSTELSLSKTPKNPIK
jgi:hypothetical protein